MENSGEVFLLIVIDDILASCSCLCSGVLDLILMTIDVVLILMTIEVMGSSP
jgi:hypothetical protein